MSKAKEALEAALDEMVEQVDRNAGDGADVFEADEMLRYYLEWCEMMGEEPAERFKPKT